MTTLITTTVVALVLGAASYYVYTKAQTTIPKQQRLRLLMFLMTLPIVIIATATVQNPLPAVIALVSGFFASSGGPSG